MSNVTKKELVEKIAEQTGITQVDTKMVVESFLQAISDCLKEGRNIEIRGFGRYKIRRRKARIARNPRTGDPVAVEAGIRPVFEPSKELRQYIIPSWSPLPMAETIIASNRKAHHDYTVLDTWEAGICLSGTEVKSLRDRACQIAEAFVIERDGELFLNNATIGIYAQGNRWNHEQKRQRKLLLHRKEMDKIIVGINKKGCTLIPLKMYFKESWVKVEIGLCEGKDKYDKRQDKLKQEAKREISRALRHAQR